MPIGHSNPFPAPLWELEGCDKKFEVKLFDCTVTLFTLVTAPHFPAAYAKAKRLAAAQDMRLGRIVQV